MTKQNNNSTRRRRPYANEAPYCRRFGDGLTQKKKRNKNRFQPAHLHSDRQITTFLLETGIKIVSSLVLFCFFWGQKKEKPDLESSPANGLRFQIGGFVNKRERERVERVLDIDWCRVKNGASRKRNTENGPRCRTKRRRKRTRRRRRGRRKKKNAVERRRDVVSSTGNRRGRSASLLFAAVGLQFLFFHSFFFNSRLLSIIDFHVFLFIVPFFLGRSGNSVRPATCRRRPASLIGASCDLVVVVVVAVVAVVRRRRLIVDAWKTASTEIDDARTSRGHWPSRRPIGVVRRAK